MIIDAKDTILGRLGSFVARQVLLGNEVNIVNCEEAVVSGKKANVFANYIRRIDRKAPGKGPYLYRRPDMFVRRTIRGMLPFKRSRGRDAFKKVKCHVGMPENLRNEKVLTIEGAKSGKLVSADHLKVKDICRAISGRQQ
ncbi:50S ribosomal protein L13 [Candidatus Woesearchaeota archaeon]|nr:50S ribosomal protein L13 [Candidatus Woesearchaeota archaeon]